MSSASFLQYRIKYNSIPRGDNLESNTAFSKLLSSLLNDKDDKIKNASIDLLVSIIQFKFNRNSTWFGTSFKQSTDQNDSLKNMEKCVSKLHELTIDIDEAITFENCMKLAKNPSRIILHDLPSILKKLIQDNLPIIDKKLDTKQIKFLKNAGVKINSKSDLKEGKSRPPSIIVKKNTDSNLSSEDTSASSSNSTEEIKAVVEELKKQIDNQADTLIADINKKISNIKVEYQKIFIGKDIEQFVTFTKDFKTKYETLKKNVEKIKEVKEASVNEVFQKLNESMENHRELFEYIAGFSGESLIIEKLNKYLDFKVRIQEIDNIDKKIPLLKDIKNESERLNKLISFNEIPNSINSWCEDYCKNKFLLVLELKFIPLAKLNQDNETWIESLKLLSEMNDILDKTPFTTEENDKFNAKIAEIERKVNDSTINKQLKQELHVWIERNLISRLRKMEEARDETNKKIELKLADIKEKYKNIYDKAIEENEQKNKIYLNSFEDTISANAQIASWQYIITQIDAYAQTEGAKLSPDLEVDKQPKIQSILKSCINEKYKINKKILFLMKRVNQVFIEYYPKNDIDKMGLIQDAGLGDLTNNDLEHIIPKMKIFEDERVKMLTDLKESLELDLIKKTNELKQEHKKYKSKWKEIYAIEEERKIKKFMDENPTIVLSIPWLLFSYS